LGPEIWKEMSPRVAEAVRGALDALAKRLEETTAKLTRLRALVEQQAETIKRLRAENDRLSRRMRELEAQLRQNSGNSNRPPSSDPVGQKRRKKKPTGRNRGAQPGHARHEAPLYPPEEVTEFREIRPSRCACCGAVLEGEDPSPERRQVVELPPVRPMVVEYRVHRLRCSRCGRETKGELPAEGSRRFGPRVTALVGLLGTWYRLPKRSTQGLLEECFGIRMSLGQVPACERELGEALAEAYESLRARVRGARVVYADETSWRVAKERAYLWVAVTEEVTCYQIRPSRSQEAAKELLGADTQAIVHTDGYSGYNWIPKHRRQLCLAHLVRQAKGMAERGGKAGRVGAVLRNNLEYALGEHRRMREGQIKHSTLRTEVTKHARWWVRETLAEGAAVRCAKTAGTCRHLQRHEPSLWLFLYHDDVEPTNNAAERALRPAVIWRKTSYGNDSESGARCTERLLSVVQTCRQLGRDIWTYLTEALTAFRAGREPPPLLPEPST